MRQQKKFNPRKDDDDDDDFDDGDSDQFIQNKQIHKKTNFNYV